MEAGRATSAMHAERRGVPVKRDNIRGHTPPSSTPVFRPPTADELKSGFRSPREGDIRPEKSTAL
jgi:hypothetical protein